MLRNRKRLLCDWMMVLFLPIVFLLMLWEIGAFADWRHQLAEHNRLAAACVFFGGYLSLMWWVGCDKEGYAQRVPPGVRAVCHWQPQA